MAEEKNENIIEPTGNSQTEKLFWTVGEVAKMFNVNPSLIRFWENEFSIIKPKRNAKGNRMFTKKDIENFHLIYHLVKERGMTLAGAKQKLKISKDDQGNEFEVVKILKNLRALVVDLKDNLEEIEKK